MKIMHDYEFDVSSVDDGFGVCYIVEFNNGVVKPGSSKNILKRFKIHKADAKKHGADILRIAITARHKTYRKTETSMLAALLKDSKNCHGEYFQNASFDSFIESMELLGVHFSVHGKVSRMKADNNQLKLMPSNNQESINDVIEVNELNYDSSVIFLKKSGFVIAHKRLIPHGVLSSSQIIIRANYNGAKSIIISSTCEKTKENSKNELIEELRQSNLEVIGHFFSDKKYMDARAGDFLAGDSLRCKMPARTTGAMKYG